LNHLVEEVKRIEGVKVFAIGGALLATELDAKRAIDQVNREAVYRYG
jgi:hypothetical protein